MTPPERRTRGRTSRSRLRALDAYLHQCERPLLERQDGTWRDAAFLDVGFGEHPWTTLESAALFRELNPQLPVIGVEADRAGPPPRPATRKRSPASSRAASTGPPRRDSPHASCER